jgi:cellulose biosynthesis protein BcsQ
MKTLAFYSLKGGVGKTAAAVNLAYAAAEHGLRTLLVDLDAQGAATFYLAAEARGVKARALLAGGARLGALVQATGYPDLDLLPSSRSLRNLAALLTDTRKPRTQLADSLREVASGYDLMVLDTHAGLDLEAENVFQAADHVLVPLVPSFLSVNALRMVQGFLEEHDVPARRLRFFFSLVDGRRKVHQEVMASLAADPASLGVVVPCSAQVERMGVDRAPLLARHGSGRGVESFRALFAAVLPLIGLRRRNAR